MASNSSTGKVTSPPPSDSGDQVRQGPSVPPPAPEAHRLLNCQAVSLKFGVLPVVADSFAGVFQPSFTPESRSNPRLLYPAPVPPYPQYDLEDGSYYPDDGGSQGIKAVVEEQGYISLHLRYNVQVNIAPNQAIRVVNNRKSITLALSGCATQMAMVHPQGRVLQYNSRIEIQTENYPSIKNAKMWPRGVSFTSNNRALVYLVDQAGARSTTDTFHDLYADNIADSKFFPHFFLSKDTFLLPPLQKKGLRIAVRHFLIFRETATQYYCENKLSGF